MDSKKRIAIVGAGASGLPAIRHALLYGLEPVCFEITDGIGGLWRYKEETRTFKGVHLSSVMKTTVINSSKELTAYSDFPPHPEAGNFMHNREMLKYFEEYAEHYELKKFIKFNHKVENIERSDDYIKTGRWKVTYLNEKDEKYSEIFDGVLLATGHHSNPHFPKPYPGQSEFQGKILHSHDYTDHKGFEDKNVVVVGTGNSGGDLAVELSRISKQVYLVSRKGAWILNRISKNGYPFDAEFNRRLGNFIRYFIPFSVVATIFEKKIQKNFNHEFYGLKPKHRISAAHPTINDELPNRIANRTIKVKPNIAKFKERNVYFEDLTDAEDVDVVIFATGYSFDFPMLENGELIPVTRNEVDLYLNMFSPNLSDFNTLAVLGLIQPIGSIMPISEMQARLFFAQFTGEVSLPSKESMLMSIASSKSKVQKRYYNSPRHTIQVDYSDYMDELAGIIGCKPNVLKYLWTDFALGQKLLTGQVTSYTYRLDGPHPWEKARETILTTEFRMQAGMAPEGGSSALSRNLALYMKADFPSFSSILIYVLIAVIFYYIL
ncbi:hypothetical protein FO519_005581 [Halicephalobus sp. NKZ332]|nr:hypothetical protein FO519_005581 [Halicephalobus sp. NKZ332]